MKKYISVFAITAVIMMTSVSAYAGEAPENSAGSAILMECSGGEVLYGKHADKTMLIASTTKIMTALVVLENCELSESVEIKPEWTGVEGSSVYLKSGEVMTVEELLYCLLLNSGNDAAVALACHTSGSVEDFAELMNERAAGLGLVGTSFANPHGLDAENHYSTAHDLAIITQAAMENETFEKIVSTKEIIAAGRALKNHNKLLWEYDGAIGVKTGYTKSAGRILVSCAEREGLRLICVTISDPDDWDDHSALYDWAFSEYDIVQAVPEDMLEFSVPVISGVKSEVCVAADGGMDILLRNGDKLELTAELPRFVYAGVTVGERAGLLTVKKNGEAVGTVELLYKESVARDEAQLLTLGEKIKRFIFGE